MIGIVVDIVESTGSDAYGSPGVASADEGGEVARPSGFRILVSDDETIERLDLDGAERAGGRKCEERVCEVLGIVDGRILRSSLCEIVSERAMREGRRQTFISSS